MTCIKTKFKSKIRNLKKVFFSKTLGKKYTVDTGEARKVSESFFVASRKTNLEFLPKKFTFHVEISQIMQDSRKGSSLSASKTSKDDQKTIYTQATPNTSKSR